MAEDGQGRMERLRECASMLAQALFQAEDVAVAEDVVNAVLLERGLRYRLGTPASASAPLETVDVLERRHIVRVLAATKGNKSEAARVLGFDRRTLYRKLQLMRKET